MRVVVAEPETLMRAGLVLVLEQGGFDVVGETGDMAELVDVVTMTEPDVVVADIGMLPTLVDASRLGSAPFRTLLPRVGIILLSQHLHRGHALDLLGDNVAGIGYLLARRVTDIDEFYRGVRRVAEGGTVLDAEALDLVSTRVPKPSFSLDRLTRRQRDVLALMATGRSNMAIARSLSISEKTVVSHVSHIYHCLDVAAREDDHRRVTAVIKYLSL
jgi:DNA-binding NarL/FixJ family response regulator